MRFYLHLSQTKAKS